MTPVRRWLLPHPVLSASLLVIWLVLHDSVAPGHVLLGAVLGVAIPLLTRVFWPDRPPFHRLPLLWRLFFAVNWDILVANLAVARLILTRRSRALRPRFLVVPLDVRSPYAVTILAGIITMTPGTVAADLDEEHGLLLVHSLDERDPEGAVARIKSRYEQPLKEILG